MIIHDENFGFFHKRTRCRLQACPPSVWRVARYRVLGTGYLKLDT
jgi:hypothetical protein